MLQFEDTEGIVAGRWCVHCLPQDMLNSELCVWKACASAQASTGCGICSFAQLQPRFVMGSAEFDQFASCYEKTMERSCAISGESPDFCAEQRMEWCLRRLRQYLGTVRLLKQAGFRVEFVDYCFLFPHFARRLRAREPALRWLPLGAQYLVLARK